MAEIAAVGFAASIVTYLGVSARALKRRHEYQSTASDAPAVFRDAASQLPLIVKVLERAKHDYDSGVRPGAADDAQQQLAIVVNGCRKQVARLDVLLDKMLPHAADSPYRRARRPCRASCARKTWPTCSGEWPRRCTS
jgi:hypothetical protein